MKIKDLIQVRNEYSLLLSKLLYNCQLKKKGGALILQRDLGGWGAAGIFGTFSASLFNEDLSNEHNFGRIHLAGKYLYTIFKNHGWPSEHFLGSQAKNTFYTADADVNFFFPCFQ